MPQSLSRVILHTVFSTKNRIPYLMDKSFRLDLHRYLGGIANGLGCQPLIVGGAEDHVHVLTALSRTLAIAGLVKEFKRVSTHWIHAQRKLPTSFRWQAGYGVFSIAQSELQIVREYIARQEEHHRRTTFQEEYRELLRRYEIECDERYVWD